jgi:hypothetical protein
MNPPSFTPVTPATHSEPQGYVRLHGRWPLVMRGVWLVALALSFASLFSSFPLYLAQLQTPCVTPTCSYQHLTPAQFALLGEIGVTPSVYVAITALLVLAALIVCWALSALIIWRRPDDWMAALVALMLIPTGPLPIDVALPVRRMPWLRPDGYVVTAHLVMLAVVFCLFPSGRFAPRWTKWVLVGVIVLQTPAYFLPSGLAETDTPAGKLGFDIAVVEMVALVVGQLIRYRRISTPLQRQQTKWVVIGLTAPVLYYVGFIVVTLLFPAVFPNNPIGVLFYYENSFLLPLFLAIGFALAMLRYRLWEIDALINRALVYGALTLSLTTLYAGLVIGLQALSRDLIGQDNHIVIVLSTLVIAGLVLPLRRWLQAFIDRRFYRSSYNASRTIQAFSAGLRHEIQIEALREQLLRVVDETMRPSHVSLWLRATPARAPATPESR